MRVLGARLRPITAGIYVGTVGQLEVHAASGPRGWRVCAIDVRSDATLAFGAGETIELAERAAERSFARRIAA